MSNSFDMSSHLESRNLDISLYSNCYMSNNSVVFMLFDINGDMTGYHEYNPFGEKTKPEFGVQKYKTHTKPEAVAFWGLDVFDPSKGVLFIVEGLFKASALHKLGLNAFAVFGNSAKSLSATLLSLGVKLVAVCDNDDAGRILGKSVEKIGGVAIILERDADEYTTDELREELSDVIFGLCGRS